MIIWEKTTCDPCEYIMDNTILISCENPSEHKGLLHSTFKGKCRHAHNEVQDYFWELYTSSCVCFQCISIYSDQQSKATALVDFCVEDTSKPHMVSKDDALSSYDHISRLLITFINCFGPRSNLAKHQA